VLAVAACLAAVAIIACGQSDRRRNTSTFSSLARSAPARHPASPAAHGKTTTTAAQPVVTAAMLRLKRQIKRALAHSGPEVGLLVEDLSRAQILDARKAAVPRPPASVEKLYTTVAALDLLGPKARLQTTVLGTGGLGARGVWHGNLYLHGGGDPTLGDGNWNKLYEEGHGPTALELAQQMHRAGIRRVTGRIFADASLFDTDPGGPATNYLADTPDYGGEMNALVYDHGMSTARMSPAVFAAHELALTLRDMGVRVVTASRTQSTPSAAVELAHVESPPLSVLVRLMDVPSDDLIADMLDKQMGARLAGQGTLAAGAGEITQVIARDYDLHPTVFDGSGLDRSDQTTPADVVTLLRRVWTTPTGTLLYGALPVVGEQGTVMDIGLHTPAQRRCVAKTGTLNNVTNLAGYCHARNGSLLTFALMIDGPSNAQSFPVLSRVVAAIARY
jgi:D-alanyl-D-alanine carboxypeptidase/D-alanyl-D-alanine-endopeptidase (penicillin-binding protein 4)